MTGSKKKGCRQEYDTHWLRFVVQYRQEVLWCSQLKPTLDAHKERGRSLSGEPLAGVT